ncbi:spore coat U domain-containing protein [Pseudochrobactrum sp. MP213Fo]|uniref:Csu type fimbrial protein n=1 Tax=Pseudochrobactrum sp. MP213Fo TaxID=3022250 RepID=UPI003BA100E5
MSCLMIYAGLMSASHATDATGSLQAKLAIGAACQLTSGDGSALDFGRVDNLNDDVNAETAAGSGIKVKCGNGIAYKLGLDDGLNTETVYVGHQRMMSGPDSILVPYELYQDAARQVQWLDIDDGNVFKGTGDGAEHEIPVYGTIKGGGDTPASGEYTDTVTVTLQF